MKRADHQRENRNHRLAETYGGGKPAPDRIWLTTLASGNVDEFTMWDDQPFPQSAWPLTSYVRADLVESVEDAAWDLLMELAEVEGITPQMDVILNTLFATLGPLDFSAKRPKDVTS